jgi:hypothetical protein
MYVPSTSLACAAMAVTVLSGSTVGAGGVERADLVVRVYDQSGGGRADSAKALGVAAEILAGASIRVQWRVCVDPRPDPGCDALPANGEREVRLMQSRDARQSISGNALGHVVDPRTWLQVWMFLDRVAKQSARVGCDLQLLLGRAIAHEIGHLLLKQGKHSPDGLMRATFSDASLRLSQPEDWQFTASQAAAMRARLR